MSQHMEFNGRILTVADGHYGRVLLMVGGGNNHAAVGVSVPADHRAHVAQLVAGDGYRIVPVADADGEAETADQLRVAFLDCAAALVKTVEYVGHEILPAVPGWSWYDALAKHAPEDLADVVPDPPRVIQGHQRVDRARHGDGQPAECSCGWTSIGIDTDTPSKAHAHHVWEMLRRHGVTRQEVSGDA